MNTRQELLRSVDGAGMKARKHCLGKFVVLGVALCCAVAAAESRILHLPGGFAQPYGSYTTGGEFPGAKAEL